MTNVIKTPDIAGMTIGYSNVNNSSNSNNYFNYSSNSDNKLNPLEYKCNKAYLAYVL